MKKILYLILFISLWNVGKAADSDWRIHPIFDEEVAHVVETPEYVYFTSKNTKDFGTADVFSSLFRYDKKGEELMELSTTNLLNGNNVRTIMYNPAKGYLAVVYKDFNIDLLYNNGDVVNIPYYSLATLSSSKNVNSITYDGPNNRLYLATDFGYVAINDKKYEVAESRIYGEPLKAITRLGDQYLIIRGNDLLKAPVSSSRLSLDQYTHAGTFNNPVSLHPLNDNTFLLVEGLNNYKYIYKIVADGEGFKSEKIMEGTVYNIENTSTGLSVAGADRIYLFRNDGSVSSETRPEGYTGSAAVSTSGSEIWNGLMRKGLSSVKKTGETWSVTRDWMLPNAPATFVSTSFANHPTKGFLMLNYGTTPVTFTINDNVPMQLSGYKQGRWTNYAPSYTNPARTNILLPSNGIAVDPDNPKYVYVTSYHNGFARFNLEDPNDIIHLSRSNDPNAGQDGFVALDFLGPSSFASMSVPYFDNKGNLWILFLESLDREEPNPHYICWLAEDRKATTSAQNIRLPKHVEFDVYIPYSNLWLSIPLKKTGNGLHVMTVMENNITFFNVLDTKGTPVETSDDKIYTFPNFTDTDGNEVFLGRVRYLYEDQSTGYVWICYDGGVCYFAPSQVLAGNYQLHRVKVPRNDGTNLADYLLDGVAVNELAVDADGRKWFATSGGGLICTTSDGREILEEFNTSNSPLPSDMVYGVGYNSENNSLMISTENGYIEYSLPSSTSSSSKADIKAYPNPVRPEYSGYVTITDIPQGSFVKITDSAGHLVKELGTMTGFEILWDISDWKFNRVKSGVYHIMVSPSNEDSSYTAVGKILVVS